MTCPAASAAALSEVGEFILELAKNRSEAERCAIAQKLLALIPEGGAEDTDLPASDDVTLEGWVLMNCFLLIVVCLAAYFARVMYKESLRYSNHHALETGTYSQYLLYRFGYWYTWTPGSAGIVLLSMSLCLLVSGALFQRILLQQPISEGLWAAWLWVAAPDGGGSAESPIHRLIGLSISIGGMLVFALLLSVISATFEDALQGLREGVGPVIEGDHIVILGYLTPMLQIIAKELCNANESAGGVLIAILSPLPKPDVEDFLREADGDIKDWVKNSTIVVRSGDACSIEDLTKVAAKSARKVLIMSKPGVSREEADALTLNVLLTMHNNHWPLQGRCIVQCQLVRNQGVFKRLLNETSQVLTTNDFIAELMVQSAMQSGLVNVVRSVFCFEGDEFYIQRIQGTAGRTFIEVLFSLPGVILVGIMTPGGSLELLPAMDRIIEADDALCILAEDDSTVPEQATPGTLKDIRGTDASEMQIVSQHPETPAQKQTIVVCGWNDMIGAALSEIEKNVAKGSQVIIHSPQPVESRTEFIESSQKRRNHCFQNITIQHQQGPLAARFQLEELPLAEASMILVLADESCESARTADSQTMAVVIQVQDILEKRCGTAGSSAVIMPQLLDTNTEETAVQTGIHNYIMSSRLAARIMAVVSEVPQTINIIDCLVKTRVCKLAITKLPEYPAAASLDLSVGVSFNDVTWVAALTNEIVLGWSQLGAGSAGPWEMNPQNRTEKRQWSPEARLVVLKRTRHQEETF